MKIRTLLIVMIMIASLAATAGGITGKSIELPVVTVELKAGEGRNKVEEKCASCHSLDYITTQPVLTRAQWTATVKKMVTVMGAPLTEADIKAVSDYLVRNYGQGD